MALGSHVEEEYLVPNKLLLCKLRNKRTNYWYCRVYAGNKKYVYRSLKTEDKAIARDRAYEKWMEVRDQINKTGSASPKTIRFFCDKWIKRQAARQAGGNLSHSLYKSHRHLFDVYVPAYAAFKKWTYVKNIPLDGWIEYRQWRKEEGWKLIGTDKGGNIRNGTTKVRKPPKDSSINREVTMIQEWFKHMLVPERIAIASPVIEKTKVRRVDLTANPPFSPSDYTKIQRRFRKWSEDKTSKSPEWRKVVYHFFLVCTNVGWRPDSEGLATKWSQLKVRKRIDQIPKSDEEGNVLSTAEKEVWVAHLDIWDRKNKEWREGNFLGGEYFIRLKDLYLSWHKKDPESFHKPTSEDLIFLHPKTGKKINYNTLYNAYKEVLASLDLKEKYTFYSCRAFYVTERIKEGVDSYTVAKQTGHSLEVCRRHYERIKMDDMSDEATKRTYGKKKADMGESLF